MELGGKPIDADRKYKVAGWAPVSDDAKSAGGEAIWDVIERYLHDQKTIRPRMPNVPALAGVSGDPGVAPASL
jgi:sulfur-oxidizing protein SoxB